MESLPEGFMKCLACSMPHPADVLEYLQLLNEYSTCTGVANGTSFAIGSSMTTTTGAATDSRRLVVRGVVVHIRPMVVKAAQTEFYCISKPKFTLVRE